MDYSKLVIHTDRTSRVYPEDAPRAVRKNGVKDLRDRPLRIPGHNWQKQEKIPGGRARHFDCSCGHDEGISVNEDVGRDVHQEHLRSLSLALSR